MKIFLFLNIICFICIMLLYVCCQGWPFSIEYIISALFPGEEFFLHSQNFLVACCSVYRVNSWWIFSIYFGLSIGDIHVQLMFMQSYWWEFMHGSFFFFFFFCCTTTIFFFSNVSNVGRDEEEQWVSVPRGTT